MAVIRICKHHGEVKFWKSGPSWKCSMCGQERVREYRRKRKKELVERLGGSCVRCGYKKSFAALEFHHKDPSTKNPKLKSRRDTNPVTYLSKAEMEKEMPLLELLCANCHAEEHWGE